MANLNITSKTFPLNTGAQIPALGLGTWQSKPEEVAKAVKFALQKGYRHIDTALAYENEAEVGQGIKDSKVPRKEIWLTTKLENVWHDRIEEGLDKSLKELGTEYVDLCLIHWPHPAESKQVPDWDFIKTWQEMQKLPATGKVRNIGVSNFSIKNLERLLSNSSCRTTPAVNQIELHPKQPQPNLVAYCHSKDIHCTGISCLGSYSSPLFKDPTITLMGDKRGRTSAQVLLHWGIQRGWSVIPQSTTKTKIEENFDLDGWELNEREMKELDLMADRDALEM